MLSTAPPEFFERDMACTEAEWLGWLPAAIGPWPWQRDGACAVVLLGPGSLHLHWQSAPPRQIALLRLPRLLVRFQFHAVNAEERARFVARFDLYTRRGGG